MTTPSTSRRTWKYVPLVLGLAALASSCGFSQGQLLFVLGFGRGQKVEAKFRLTQSPILILIDDSAHRVDWPPTTRYLFDDLAQELLRNKAALKFVPSATLAHLRQSHPDFADRGCREIGEMAGAEQVLWLEVQDFRAREQVEEALVAAFFSVRIKVINVLETNRSRVRIWPTLPQGHLITVSLTGSEVVMAKTKDAICKKLVRNLAVRIAKLFYDHRLGDFERES